MCFSAEASFTAATVLALIGTGLMMMRKPKQLKYLSFIPILFALQQASEGALWLLLPTDPQSAMTHFFQLTFLFFAFIVWPIWIPLSLFAAEKIKWRKIAIGCILLAGILYAIFDLSYVIGNELTVEILGRSIAYNMQHNFDWDLWALKALYGLIVLTPCFLSSLKCIKGYGYLIIASWTAAALLFQATFTSSWCFFASLISFYLVFVIRKNRE